MHKESHQEKKAMPSDQTEQLLDAVQKLRKHLKEFPMAEASFKSIQRYWMPNTLFPPDDQLLHQALNVLINAGEMSVDRKVDGNIQYRCNSGTINATRST